MTARAALPGDIMLVPITFKMLVDARGITPEDRIEDAKLQARKSLDPGLSVEVGTPEVMSHAG